MKLSLTALLERLPPSAGSRPPARRAAAAVAARDPIPIEFVMQAIAKIMTPDTIIVEEAPSHRPALQNFVPIRRSGGFYTMASGGLGFGLPAAVGIAMAERRRVICFVGDGSAMYSIQALWTAAQHELPLTIVVLNNGGYGALRAFGTLLQSKNLPPMDLPGIDFQALARGFGCKSVRVSKAQDVMEALSRAVREHGPVIVDIAIDPNTGAVY